MRNLSTLMLALVFLLNPSAHAADSQTITGFAKVDKNVYRGGRPKNGNQMRMLAKSGIRTVINLQGYSVKILRGESEEEIQAAEVSAKRIGLRYLQLPFETAKTLDEIDQATVLEVARAMNDPQLQPVYVHCNIGADRTGVAVAAYRILYQGCSFAQARKEIISEGKFWTRIFTSPQSSFLRKIAANQRKISGTLQQKCPLPKIK